MIHSILSKVLDYIFFFHLFLDLNFIGVFTDENAYSMVKCDNFCFLIKKKNSYLYVNVTPSILFLIQRDGFLNHNFDNNFLTYLQRLSSNRLVYANPPLSRDHIDCLTFCAFFHKLIKSESCFYKSCALLNDL